MRTVRPHPCAQTQIQKQRDIIALEDVVRLAQRLNAELKGVVLRSDVDVRTLQFVREKLEKASLHAQSIAELLGDASKNMA